MKTQVSKAGDFPHLRVFRRPGRGGDILSVEFVNKEYGGWKQATTALAGIAWLCLFFPVMIFLGQAAERSGTSLAWAFVIPFAIFVFLMLRLRHPWKIRRTIELDFGTDQLRVLRGKRTEISRPLSRMANLTVEDHPEAAFARNQRLEKGRKRITEQEMQHVLIGWFGISGAEQVVLLSRVEHPNRNSLFEVRQAMLWAMEQGGNAATAGQAQAPRIDGGIKPPLD